MSDFVLLGRAVDKFLRGRVCESTLEGNDERRKGRRTWRRRRRRRFIQEY
jgi:hypothetical protein